SVGHHPPGRAAHPGRTARPHPAPVLACSNNVDMKTDSPPPHLLILDGHSILRRLYEAIRGKDEDSAAHAQEASASALAKLKTSVRWHQATHALVAFDPSGP